MDTLEEMGAQPERALSCTRGLVVELDEEQVNDERLSKSNGYKLTIYDKIPHEQQQQQQRLLQGISNNIAIGVANENGQKTCQCGEYIGGGCTLTASDVDEMKAHIIETIVNWPTITFGAEDAVDAVGQLLRLAFHDRASFSRDSRNTLNGLNGCLDLTDPRNSGLEGVIEHVILETQTWVGPTGASGINKYVSKADITALAGLAAFDHLYAQRKLEDDADCDEDPECTTPTYPTYPYYDYQCGRIDILDDESCAACETTFLPSPEGSGATNIKDFHDIMSGRMKFTPREITALMATHAFGRMKEANSGYLDAPWVRNAAALSNTYFVLMFRISWIKNTRTVGDNTFTEWRGGRNRDLTYLNTDAILCFDIEDTETCDVFGGRTPNCVNNTAVSGQPFEGIKKQYGNACEEFAANEDAFLEALIDAYIKMVNAAPCGTLVTPS